MQGQNRGERGRNDVIICSFNFFKEYECHFLMASITELNHFYCQFYFLKVSLLALKTLSNNLKFLYTHYLFKKKNHFYLKLAFYIFCSLKGLYPKIN